MILSRTNGTRLLVPLLLAIDAGASAGPQAHPMHDTLPAAARVSLDAPESIVKMDSHGGRPVVEVSIDGKGPYLFILDTGAQGTVIAKDLAEELKLPVIMEAMAMSPGASAPVPGKVVRAGRLAVGAVTLEDAHLLAIDLPAIFNHENPPRGVLSASAFPGLLVTFDFPGQRMIFRRGELPSPDGAAIFGYPEGDPLPTLPVTVAGKEMRAHMDTGSGDGVSLPREMIDALPLAAAPVKVRTGKTVDRQFDILGASLEGSVAIGRFRWERPEIRFTGLPQANVGALILREFSVTLDTKNRRIRLEKAAG